MPLGKLVRGCTGAAKLGNLCKQGEFRKCESLIKMEYPPFIAQIFYKLCYLESHPDVVSGAPFYSKTFRRLMMAAEVSL